MPSTSLKAKFGLLLGLVVITNVFTLVFVHFKLNSFEHLFADFHKAGVELERSTLMVSRDVNFISRLTRSIMLGDNLDKNLEGLDKTIDQIQKHFDAMQAASKEIDNPATRESFTSLIDNSRKDTLAFANDARTRMQKLKGQELNAELLAGTWSEYQKAATPLANKARDSFKSLSEAAQNYLEGTRSGTGEALTAMKSLLILVQIAVAVVVVAFGLYLLNAIFRPLGQAAEIADRVAAGDLTTRIDARGTDETGRLLGALAKMQGQLHEVVGHLGKVSATVLQTSQGLARSVDAVSQQAQRQAESTTEMAAAIEEMTVGINHMASSAHATASNAQEAQKTANEGRSVVDQSANELRAIVNSVTQASALVGTLNQRSDEISKIVGVIKEIADQTNLLALNAAIEAARAGEQGRGFAVVADEVRKLAERTTQSTAAISEMLTSVQQATHQVVQQMADSTARVESGAEKAESSRVYMQRIGDGAIGMVEVVGDISAGLREQGQASDLVAQNVERIAQMTEQTSAELRTVNQAARELDKIALELKEAIAVFRI